MTLNELVEQLYDLSEPMGHYFNCEKFSKKRLKTIIVHWLPESPKAPQHLQFIVAIIRLPDGEWYFRINRFPELGDDFYDYTIPDTREQELKIIEQLNHKWD